MNENESDRSTVGKSTMTRDITTTNEYLQPH